jgi:4-amino-4-deoxy-L-arabinose transferase-like glycosyltransferase
VFRSTSHLAALALLKLLLHLATHRGYGLFRDEFYYLACSEHLALGYVDHPPLSILLLWLSRAALGDSLLAIRFLPAVAGAVTVYLTGLMARELGGGRSAQLLAALATFVAPVFLALSHFFSMNAFDQLFWALLALIAIRILVRDEPRLWIAFGAVAGLGLQNKYSVAFFGFGIAVGLLASAQRRQLASRWLWLGGGLALLLFLPHLVWQAHAGWPTLEFMANAQAEKNIALAPGEFLLQQIVMAHPMALPIWLAGLGGLLLSARLRRLRPLGWAYPATFALLAIQKTKAYYLMPIYPLLFAAGAVELEAFFERRRWRWGMPAAASLLPTPGPP